MAKNKEKKPKENVLYALHFEGEQLNSNSFKKYWKNYGSTGSALQGWRPPKKIYSKLGHAKTGICHVPAEIRPKVEIVEYRPVRVVQVGSSKDNIASE